MILKCLWLWLPKVMSLKREGEVEKEKTGKGGREGERRVLKTCKDKMIGMERLFSVLQPTYQDITIFSTPVFSPIPKFTKATWVYIRKGEGIPKNEAAVISATDRMKSSFWKSS